MSVLELVQCVCAIKTFNCFFFWSFYNVPVLHNFRRTKARSTQSSSVVDMASHAWLDKTAVVRFPTARQRLSIISKVIVDFETIRSSRRGEKCGLCCIVIAILFNFFLDFYLVRDVNYSDCTHANFLFCFWFVCFFSSKCVHETCWDVELFQHSGASITRWKVSQLRKLHNAGSKDGPALTMDPNVACHVLRLSVYA